MTTENESPVVIYEHADKAVDVRLDTEKRPSGIAFSR